MKFRKWVWTYMKQIHYAQNFRKYFLIASDFDFQLSCGNFLTHKNQWPVPTK